MYWLKSMRCPYRSSFIPDFVELIILSSKLNTMDRSCAFYRCPNCNHPFHAISHYAGMRNCDICWMAVHPHHVVSEWSHFFIFRITTFLYSKFFIGFRFAIEIDKDLIDFFVLKLWFIGQNQWRRNDDEIHHEPILPERLWIWMAQ